MINLIDSAISITTLIWLFPIAFMLHDFEEIIWIEPWFQKNYSKIKHRIPRPFQKKIGELSKMTSSQFAIAVLVEFILFIPFTFYAAESERYLFFLGFNLLLFLHVFMHLGQAVFTKMLTPGVVSGMMITLPYTMYLIYRLLNDNIINWSDIFISIPFGIILIPTVIFGHYIGKRIMPARNY